MSESSPTARRRWIRFSLRLLLLLFVVIGVPLSWKVNRVRHQRDVVAEIEKLGGSAYYDYHRYAFNNGQAPRPPGPAWLRHALGDDFFADVVQVQLHGPQVTDETLVRVTSLPKLRLLGVVSDRITDRGVATIAESRRLESLTLKSNNITDESLEHLQRLPDLVFLRYSRTQVDDAWIERIARLKSLENLVVSNARVTDDGLARLAKLTTLEGLYFEDTPITDAGLDRLRGMSNLKRLGVHGTQVTPAGLKRFQAAQPGCVVRKY